MSYEKNGLGWSDIPITTGWWPFEETTYPRCSDVTDGIQKCFTDHPDDQRCATYSGCRELTGQTCETVSQKPGTKWCCPPDKPPPPPAPCIPEGATTTPAATAQGGMTCRFHHVPFSSLQGDAEARSIWTVQNKLCQLGIDPGPVDGTENHARYHQAIREFQARANVRVTGQPDAVTLRAMGLTNAQSIASILNPAGIGTTMPSFLPFLMVGAFGLSGAFLFFAVKKFKRSKR